MKLDRKKRKDLLCFYQVDIKKELVLDNGRLKDVQRLPNNFSVFTKGWLPSCFWLISKVRLSLNTVRKTVRALRRLSNSLRPKPRKPCILQFQVSKRISWPRWTCASNLLNHERRRMALKKKHLLWVQILNGFITLLLLVYLTNWRQFFMRLSCCWSWISSSHCRSSCGSARLLWHDNKLSNCWLSLADASHEF